MFLLENQNRHPIPHQNHSSVTIQPLRHKKFVDKVILCIFLMFRDLDLKHLKHNHNDLGHFERDKRHILLESLKIPLDAQKPFLVQPSKTRLNDDVFWTFQLEKLAQKRSEERRVG